MVHESQDELYDEAWHCVSHDHTCGGLRDHRGFGCGGPFAGWTVVQPAVLRFGPLRGEIISRVVDPCYAEMLKNRKYQDVSLEDSIALAKAINAETINTMVGIISPLVEDVADDTAARDAVFMMALASCLKGVNGG